MKERYTKHNPESRVPTTENHVQLSTVRDPTNTLKGIHPDDLRDLARWRSPTDRKSVVTPSSMKGKIVSDDNPKRRIYMRPSKPITEMSDEEIQVFAENMYQQIMGILPESDPGAHDWVISSKQFSHIITGYTQASNLGLMVTLSPPNLL